jgi:hypothetical protein
LHDGLRGVPVQGEGLILCSNGGGAEALHVPQG